MMLFQEKNDLALIEEMIRVARKEIKDDGSLYVLWGWLVLAASLGQFALLQIAYEHSYLPWMLMPIGGIISVVYAVRSSKKERIKTHVDRIMGNLWIACGVVMAVLIFTVPLLQEMFLPCMMLVYGIGTFVSGTILRFTPLKAGGFVCWALAAAAFYLPYEYQLLAIATAILVSYLVPGYMLKTRHDVQ